MNIRPTNLHEDWPTRAGQYSAAVKWLLIELESLARHYCPEPGEPGHEVEGRVIASDLNALCQVVKDGLSSEMGRFKVTP